MSSSAPTLVVMAAGMGSRFGGLKQLERLGPAGEVVLDYSVFDARRAGFARVVFVIRRDFEAQFTEQVTRRFSHLVDCACCFQELDCLPPGFTAPAERHKPWGTGHALLMAAELVDGPFAVINADDFYGRHSFELAAQLVADGQRRQAGTEHAEFGLVTFALGHTLTEFGQVARGVCELTGDGRLAQVVETLGIGREDDSRIRADDGSGGRRELADDTPVSLNLWTFTPALFTALREGFTAFLAERGDDPRAEFFLPTVVDQMIHDGRAAVRTRKSPDHWFGITYPDDKAAVSARLQALRDAGEYPERLWTPRP